MDTKAAFEKWFDKNFSLGCFSDEDREEYKVYCWLAWRDSRREAIEIPSSSDGKYWFEGAFQRMRYERDVEKSITSHGIRIKGKTE